MNPERREQFQTLAKRPMPALHEAGKLCRELVDTRCALEETLAAMVSAEAERDYLKRLRDDAYANHRVQLDAARLRYEDRIDGLLAQIRRLEAGR